MDYGTYLKESAAKIKLWMSRYCVQPIHVRILKAYHKEAWREAEVASGRGEKLLQAARCCRTRSTWEAVKKVKQHVRLPGGWKQRSGGTKTSWEALMVQFRGLFWRSSRDAMSQAEWAKDVDSFVQQVCADAGLPLCADPRDTQPQQEETDGRRPVKKQRLTFAGPEPEASELQDTPAQLFRWDQSHKSFLFICDSESLVDVVCGRAVLQDVRDAPILERITRGLCTLYAHGWTPPRLSDDPVVWMPRKHNKSADGLADYTMDIQASWDKDFDVTADPKDTNLVIQTDGGKRSGGNAAASVVVGMFIRGDAESKYQPWHAEGHHLSGEVTVFQAEAIALERAVSFVQSRIVPANFVGVPSCSETKRWSNSAASKLN